MKRGRWQKKPPKGEGLMWIWHTDWQPDTHPVIVEREGYTSRKWRFWSIPNPPPLPPKPPRRKATP